MSKKRIFNLVRSYYLSQKNRKYKGITLSEPNFSYKELNFVINLFFKRTFSSGKNTNKFEKQFTNKFGCKYGVATNSGSSANLLSLLALKKIYKIKDGSEVIIPASTFATVSMPIIQAGLIPVYVDIDVQTLNINLDQIKKAINKKTKIIMPVHTLGMPCQMREINNLAKKNNILVFEDCCEAHGAKINNKFVGSFGHISTFSFFVAHNMTTIEGGMILTNNKKLHEECLSLREFGRLKTNNGKRYYSDKILKNYDKRYVFLRLGYNMRMTEIQAVLGICQLKKLDTFNKIRIKLAKYLKENIKKKLFKFFSTTEKIDNSYTNTYYTFPIIINKNIKISRMKICQYLEKNNIQTRPMMGGCLPDQPAFRNQKGKIIGNLKNSRHIRDNCFFVGIHPMVSIKDLDYLIYKLEKFIYE